MENKEEPNQRKASSRRKFVGSIGLLSAFSALAAATSLAIPRKEDVIGCAPEAKPGEITEGQSHHLPDGNKRMVRMLTQDGKLVEIEASRLPAPGNKISNDDLQHWIKT